MFENVYDDDDVRMYVRTTDGHRSIGILSDELIRGKTERNYYNSGSGSSTSMWMWPNDIGLIKRRFTGNISQ